MTADFCTIGAAAEARSGSASAAAIPPPNNPRASRRVMSSEQVIGGGGWGGGGCQQPAADAPVALAGTAAISRTDAHALADVEPLDVCSAHLFVRSAQTRALLGILT